MTGKTSLWWVVTGAVLVLMISHVCFAGGPVSFRSAKKLVNIIYRDHQRTFYCGCDYQQQGKKLVVGWPSCGYTPRKRPARAARIEMEHIVPAYAFGHHRQCWRTGGRHYCEKTDQVFNQMEGDLHNLVPAVGEINGDRSNYRFGMLVGEPRVYGRCDFEVDFNQRRVEPRPEKRGDIARIYFYFSDRYNLELSQQQRKLFNAWSISDPVDAWECERDERIKTIQGNYNVYVSKFCHK